MDEFAVIGGLKDDEKKITEKLVLVKNHLKKYENLEPSEQQRLSDTINNCLKDLDLSLEAMRLEIKSLKNDQEQKKFKDKSDVFKEDIKKVKEEFTNLKNKFTKLDDRLSPNDIKLKVKPNSELTVQEAIDKGRGILKDDAQAINRMQKTTGQVLNIAGQIEADLVQQKGKLQQADKDLKEIDYSLNRATKQLAAMFKMYACDKLIMVMIGCILLVIIGIIIASAVGATPQGQFNVPHDIFGPKKSNTTTTTS